MVGNILGGCLFENVCTSLTTSVCPRIQKLELALPFMELESRYGVCVAKHHIQLLPGFHYQTWPQFALSRSALLLDGQSISASINNSSIVFVLSCVVRVQRLKK